MNTNKNKGLGVYVMSDAEARSQWTGETIEQAQAAIDADKARAAQAMEDLGPMIADRMAAFNRLYK